jgi:hypothetical protein
VDRHLAGVRVSASPRASDAEFLRRVHLDLTGRIPTYARTVAFLRDTDPAKRAKLIDELLDSPAFARHFAGVWRNRIAPIQDAGTKAQRDTFTPWLAEQLDADRGWDAIVTDLLTAEGPVHQSPQSAFILASSENFRPQANRLAGSVARLFWGVKLECAQCHDHPFAKWKQADFWGTAAFFGKLRHTGFKGRPAALTEEPQDEPKSTKGAKVLPAPGGAIRVPPGSGRLSGRVVKARFLGGAEPRLDDSRPRRPTFAAWATSAENPYFARATVNFLWAHLFGRGLVHPLDGVDESNPPSHPALLEKLARELAAARFDLKHVLRATCNSKAYQRTSRPVPGNEEDAKSFARMALKPLSPEALYDSLTVLLPVSEAPARAAPKGKKGGGPKDPREAFVRFFRSRGETEDLTEYRTSIPQVLRLMNGPLLQRDPPLVEALCSSSASQEQALRALYLAALSREPSPGEVKLLYGYLARRKDPRAGYRGVLWILLNSAEFAINR